MVLESSLSAFNFVKWFYHGFLLIVALRFFERGDMSGPLLLKGELDWKIKTFFLVHHPYLTIWFTEPGFGGVPADQSVCFFKHCSNGLWPPPPSPLVLNIYVADFSKGLLKKCVNACRDKCVKIVRKSLGKMSNLPIFFLQFYPQFLTILPPEGLFMSIHIAKYPPD